MDFRRVKRRKLYLQIADQILERVQDGRLSPGTRLPAERDIAAQMGVSRPSVREALIALELLGVVEIRIGQGTFVSKREPASLGALDPSKLASPLKLLEARSAIESNVALLAACKRQRREIDEQAFKRTYEITGQMKRMISEDSRLEEFYRLGLGFHKALAESVNNEILAEIVGNLVDATSHPLWTLINKKVLQNREAREEQIQEHEVVLSAIEKGNGAAAARAMRRHIEELTTLVLE